MQYVLFVNAYINNRSVDFINPPYYPTVIPHLKINHPHVTTPARGGWGLGFRESIEFGTLVGSLTNGRFFAGLKKSTSLVGFDERNPGCLVEILGMKYYPGMLGILTNHYKPFNQLTRIQWKVRPFFVYHCTCVFLIWWLFFWFIFLPKQISAPWENVVFKTCKQHEFPPKHGWWVQRVHWFFGVSSTQLDILGKTWLVKC